MFVVFLKINAAKEQLAAHMAAHKAWLQQGFDEHGFLFAGNLNQAAGGGRIKEMWLPVSRSTGEMLYLLARASQASTIVEYGSSFGISTLYLAAALRDNGGGYLIGTEFEAEKITGARRHLAEAGLSDLVELREGDALQTLQRDLPKSIDLVLLDGAKSLYKEILDILEPRLHAGSVIVADNVDYCPEYLAHIRKPGGDYLSLPFNEDVEISMRLH